MYPDDADAVALGRYLGGGVGASDAGPLATYRRPCYSFGMDAHRDQDRDPPTQPGRVVAPTNRKAKMQLVATGAASLVVLFALLHDVLTTHAPNEPYLLTEQVIVAALGVMGVTGATGQIGNVGEHFAKALPGIAEGIARAVRGTR